ncbi:MAG TPA: type I-E CRISPR-associated protein Cas5/CasD, partial [Spirochaetes bacterium]|nr:type I-E CRISPR-associated protein Cas5/CasD [Spirochaetota bacterium]
YDKTTFSVRLDDPGQILRDYQTIENTQKADGKINPNMVVSPRYYLVDASFLVALGVKSQSFLQEIETALINPHWPPYLGRKCCIPSFPVYVDAIEKDNPIDALWNKNYPIRSYTKPSQTIELNVEGLESTSRPYRKRDVYGRTRFFKYRFVHGVFKESQDFPKQNIIEEFKNESLTH